MILGETWASLDPAQNQMPLDLAHCYAVVFESPAGKKILEDLRKVAECDTARVPGDTLDSMMWWVEGRRSLVQHINTKVKQAQGVAI
jgi:hypothetical protein